MSGSIAGGRHYVHAWWNLRGDKRGVVSPANMKGYIDSHMPNGSSKIAVESTSANPRGSNPLVTESYRNVYGSFLNPVSWFTDNASDTRIDCHLWFEVARETSKSSINDFLCDAFRNASGSAGAGWSITQLREAMNNRSDTVLEDSNNMPGANPEVKCSKSSYSPVRGERGDAPSTGSLGNVLSSNSITSASDNTVVGTSPGLRNTVEDLTDDIRDKTGLNIPWWAYALGGIAALGIIGYSIRSVKLAVG